MNNPVPVGAELARESGVSVNIDVGCDGLFASKLGAYKGHVVSNRLQIIVCISDNHAAACSAVACVVTQ